MEVKARIKSLRISPKKVRLVIGLVRGKKVVWALEQLRFMGSRASQPITDLLRSAIANAENTYKLDRNNLIIKSITADKSITLKRFLPRAHGRATPMMSKFSHVDVVLAEIVPTQGVTAKKSVAKKNLSVSSRDQIHEEEINIKKGTHHNNAADLKKEVGKEIQDPRMMAKGRPKMKDTRKAPMSGSGK